MTAAGAWCCASRSTRRTASTRSIPPPGSRSTPSLLAQFPEGYRHLAYLQTRIGYKVKPDMPGLDGPEVEALYRRGEAGCRAASRGETRPARDRHALRQDLVAPRRPARRTGSCRGANRRL